MNTLFMLMGAAAMFWLGVYVLDDLGHTTLAVPVFGVAAGLLFSALIAFDDDLFVMTGKSLRGRDTDDD